MRRIIFIIGLVFSVYLGFAQEIDTNASIKNVVSKVDTMAKFSDNENALSGFLVNKLNYPQYAQEKGIQGTVKLEFVVCEDGSICNAKILSKTDSSLNKEALRVLYLMPKWKPGIKDGKAVPTYFILPLTFELDDDSPKRKRRKR